MKLNLLIGSLLAVMTASSAFASSPVPTDTPVTYGTPQVYGQGCSNEHVSFSPSTDGTSFSVLFDGFTIETKQKLQLQVCTIMVPVKVPAGRRLSLKTIDLRGYMNLQKNTWGGAGVLPRFMNAARQVKKGSWAIDWILGEKDDNFVQSTTFKPTVKSFCGGTQYLILDTFVGVHSFKGPSTVENIVTLDTIDGAGQLKGSVQAENCD